MRVNKDLLVQTFASCYAQSNSISQTLETLFNYELLSKEQFYKLLEISKESLDIKSIFNYLGIDKTLIEYIMFYNNYYTIEVSIEHAFNIVNEIKSIKKEIISSLLYPTVLIVLTSIALYFISTYIIPQILLLNPESKQEYFFIFLFLRYLPIISTGIIIFSIICTTLSILLLKKNYSKYIVKLAKIPIIGSVLTTIFSLVFTMHLKETIKNNSLSEETFNLLQKQTKNKTVKVICKNVRNELEEGVHVFNAINKQLLLRKDLKQTIMISSNSKNLYDLLDNYYQLNINQLKQRIKGFLAIFIPVVVSFIGIILILMYLLIMLPILNMSTSI